MNWSQIARERGVSATTVWRWRQRPGFADCRTREQVAAFFDLCQTGQRLVRMPAGTDDDLGGMSVAELRREKLLAETVQARQKTRDGQAELLRRLREQVGGEVRAALREWSALIKSDILPPQVARRWNKAIDGVAAKLEESYADGRIKIHFTDADFGD